MISVKNARANRASAESNTHPMERSSPRANKPLKTVTSLFATALETKSRASTPPMGPVMAILAPVMSARMKDYPYILRNPRARHAATVTMTYAMDSAHAKSPMANHAHRAMNAWGLIARTAFVAKMPAIRRAARATCLHSRRERAPLCHPDKPISMRPQFARAPRRVTAMVCARKTMANRAPWRMNACTGIVWTPFAAQARVRIRAKRATSRRHTAYARTFRAECETTMRPRYVTRHKLATVPACANWPMVSSVQRRVNARAASVSAVIQNSANPDAMNASFFDEKHDENVTMH